MLVQGIIIGLLIGVIVVIVTKKTEKIVQEFNIKMSNKPSEIINIEDPIKKILE